QNFARERNTPGQPRVLREDVGTGIQRLEYAVPDEIAAQHEGPVIWQRNPDDVAEDQHQDSHGEKRIPQGPDQPQQRSLVLDLEIANDEAAQKLAVMPDPIEPERRFYCWCPAGR